MRIVRQYIRIIVFVAGTLIGLQLPTFVDQYGRALGSHQREAELAVREFQDDADRFFEGSLEALVAHYRSSGDTVFNAGGESILVLVERRDLLVNAMSDFNDGALNPYFQTLMYPVVDVRDEVLQEYSYAVTLRPEAIALGLLTGLLLMLGLDLLLSLVLAAFGRPRSRTHA